MTTNANLVSKRFTPDEIAAIKARARIEDVVSGYVHLHKEGSLLRARCPLPGHDDRNSPSFTVYVGDQHFYCYGCAQGGDVIKFVRLVERCDFRRALEILDGGAVTTRPQAIPVPDEPPPPQPLTAEAITLLTAASETYYADLRSHGEIQTYLAGRGIELERAERFRLGFASGGMLERYTRYRGWDVEVMREIGLLAEDESHPGKWREFFRDRIIFPELRGTACVYLVGRATQPYQRIKYTGLRGAPKPLYGFDRLKGADEVYIVEGPFDWLTLLKWGYPAVAILGSHLRADLLQELATVRRVYIVTDSDDPGRAAAARLADKLGDRARVVPPLPGYKDVNELLVGHPLDGDRIFAKLVRAATASPSTEGPARTPVSPAVQPKPVAV